MPEGPTLGSGQSFPPRIGRYRLIAPIGRGAMGLVYSAHDEVKNRSVALKVMSRDLESMPETRERFCREARAAALLRHPNVITVYDAGEEDGRLFIAMELLEGSSLEAYLKRPEAEPLGRKLDLMVQICEGLVAAHGQGIVHRDLKPSNLFVRFDGLVKILDFGVARLADSSMTVSGQMLGTPQYMAPEQARGKPVDARSDIFSAGGVFYFMLSGRGPFPGPDLPRLLQQLQFEAPAPLPDVPADLVALVLQAMAKSPDQRPSRVEELLTGLVRFRRQYHAEARHLTSAARAEFDAVQKLAASVTEVEAMLGITPDGSASAGVRGLSEQHPVLVPRGAGVEAASFDRRGILLAAQAIAEQGKERTRTMEALVSYRAQLEAGERLLAGGDARGALALVEGVLAVCPQSARARDLATSARPLAHEQAAHADRLGELIQSARTAIDERRWPSAIALCEDALAVSPGDERALALRIEAEGANAQEQRRLALALQRAVERAEHAIEQQQFGEADAALREADTIQPESAVVLRLRHRLAADRAAAEAAEARRQLVASEIRGARGAFRRGRYDEAVQRLRGFLETEPGAIEAQSELSRLIALREDIASAAAIARRRVRELLGQATALAKRQSLADAASVAQQALLVDPTDAEAAGMVDELLARGLAQRLAAEERRDVETRSRLAEPLLAASRQAVGRGYLAVGLHAALAAQRVAPERPDIAPLVGQLHRHLAADDDGVVEVAGLPFPAVAPPHPTTAPAEPQPEAAGGVLAHVNHWASDLLRRRPAKG